MLSGFLNTKDYEHFQILSPHGTVLVDFEGAAAAGKALYGDWILWDADKKKCALQKRTSHYPIVGTLELASKTKYGMTSRGSPMYLFVPFRKEYPCMVVGSAERDTSCNRLAVAEFETWDSSNLPRGVLRTILGPCDDFTVNRKALLLNYNPFPKLKTIHESPEDSSFIRIPCPSMTFNIDPPGCKDVDDVLSIVLHDTTAEIWITIADVAETVHPGTDMDTLAALQAFTAYDNGNAVKPMLPATISEDKCSLLPNQERLGVSLILTVDVENPTNILSSHFVCTTVKNKKQYEYDTFAESAADDGIPVKLIANTASGILGRSTQDPHEWIEAFMLKYNMEIAKLLRKENRGVLRSHKGPRVDVLKKYESILEHDLTFLANASAEYCRSDEKNAEHYGLNANVYCHATSPLRRYADLLNQRVLKDILLGTHTQVDPDILWLNRRQKEMKQYERDLFFLDQISFNKKGSVQAVVLDKLETKMKLWIVDWKRILSWKPRDLNSEINEGNTISLSYFANPCGRNWKEKIVFRLEK